MVSKDVMDGSTTASLRVMNTRSVLTQLRKDLEPHTLGQLATSVGLTRLTIEGALNELITLGLAEEAPSPVNAKRSVGRPARHYRFRPEAATAVGIDLRPDRIRVEMVDLAGQTIGHHFQGELDLADPREAVKAAQRYVCTLLEETHLTPDSIHGVAVSVPGIVDPSGKLWKSVVVPDWVSGDIGALLAQAFPSCQPVFIDNAANHAALSESRLGQGSTASSLVFILVDEGIGAAAVHAGKIFRGFRGAATEIGVIDALRWSTASERLMKRIGTHDLGRVSTFPQSKGKTRDALKDFAHDIAIGTSAMVLAFDPELVVLGGVITGADDSFIDIIRDDVTASVLYPPTIIRATFGEDAVVRGASCRALAAAENAIFPPQPAWIRPPI